MTSTQIESGCDIASHGAVPLPVVSPAERLLLLKEHKNFPPALRPVVDQLGANVELGAIAQDYRALGRGVVEFSLDLILRGHFHTNPERCVAEVVVILDEGESSRSDVAYLLAVDPNKVTPEHLSLIQRSKRPECFRFRLEELCKLFFNEYRDPNQHGIQIRAEVALGIIRASAKVFTSEDDHVRFLMKPAAPGAPPRVAGLLCYCDLSSAEAVEHVAELLPPSERVRALELAVIRRGLFSQASTPTPLLSYLEGISRSVFGLEALHRLRGGVITGPEGTDPASITELMESAGSLFIPFCAAARSVTEAYAAICPELCTRVSATVADIEARYPIPANLWRQVAMKSYDPNLLTRAIDSLVDCGCTIDDTWIREASTAVYGRAGLTLIAPRPRRDPITPNVLCPVFSPNGPRDTHAFHEVMLHTLPTTNVVQYSLLGGVPVASHQCTIPLRDEWSSMITDLSLILPIFPIRSVSFEINRPVTGFARALVRLLESPIGVNVGHISVMSLNEAIPQFIVEQFRNEFVEAFFEFFGTSDRTITLEGVRAISSGPSYTTVGGVTILDRPDGIDVYAQGSHFARRTFELHNIAVGHLLLPSGTEVDILAGPGNAA